MRKISNTLSFPSHFLLFLLKTLNPFPLSIPICKFIFTTVQFWEWLFSTVRNWEVRGPVLILSQNSESGHHCRPLDCWLTGLAWSMVAGGRGGAVLHLLSAYESTRLLKLLTMVDAQKAQYCGSHIFLFLSFTVDRKQELLFCFLELTWSLPWML